VLQEALRWAPHVTRSHLQDYLNLAPSRNIKGAATPLSGQHVLAGVALATECMMKYTSRPQPSPAVSCNEIFLEFVLNDCVSGWIGARANSNEWTSRVVADDGLSVSEEQIVRGGCRTGCRTAGARGEQRLRKTGRCFGLQGLGRLQEEKRHRACHLSVEVDGSPHLLAGGLSATFACRHLVTSTTL
jgi:hypothetical protein